MTVNRNGVCKIAVSASVTDGGLLSYQWYEASAENTKEITPINGAVTSTFTCDTGKGGTRYYRCEVVNTKNGKMESSFSNIASVTVNTPVPMLDYNIKKTSVNPGENAELKVTLLLSDSEKGKITYQWYESAKNNRDNAKAISDATSDSCTIDGNAHSGTTRYYFCKITNELNGEKYTNMDDGMTMVEVTFAGQHVHEYGDWKVTTEPTCTESGTKIRSCECGDKQTETVSALGHTYGEWTVKIAVTMNTEGQEERSCTKCGYTEARAIPVATIQSTGAISGTGSEVQTNGQQVAQNKSGWWVVVPVLLGAAGGTIYGLALLRKKKSGNNKS